MPGQRYVLLGHMWYACMPGDTSRYYLYQFFNNHTHFNRTVDCPKIKTCLRSQLFSFSHSWSYTGQHHTPLSGDNLTMHQTPQQTRYASSMLIWCWTNVVDSGTISNPALGKRGVNAVTKADSMNEEPNVGTSYQKFWNAGSMINNCPHCFLALNQHLFTFPAALTIHHNYLTHGVS